MLNAEFKLGAAGFLSLPNAPAARGAGGGEFSSLYRQLNAEVGRFIEQGSSGAAAGLNPEGLMHRMQSTSAAAGLVADTAEAPSEAQQAWLREIAPHAEAAGRQLGVAPDVLAAQAALETGWGQRPIRREDGADSHNLFALKAGGAWRGQTAEVLTTEYEQGEASQRREAFRSYAGPREAFQDFTRLMQSSPRYQGALQTGADALAYGRALQKGGYATDPAYADKLAQVAARIRSGQ